MKNIIMLLFTAVGIFNLQSCTADSIQEIEADLEVHAWDEDSLPDNPKDLPDDDQEEGEN